MTRRKACLESILSADDTWEGDEEGAAENAGKHDEEVDVGAAGPKQAALVQWAARRHRNRRKAHSDNEPDDSKPTRLSRKLDLSSDGAALENESAVYTAVTHLVESLTIIEAARDELKEARRNTNPLGELASACGTVKNYYRARATVRDKVAEAIGVGSADLRLDIKPRHAATYFEHCKRFVELHKNAQPDFGLDDIYHGGARCRHGQARRRQVCIGRGIDREAFSSCQACSRPLSDGGQECRLRCDGCAVLNDI